MTQKFHYLLIFILILFNSCTDVTEKKQDEKNEVVEMISNSGITFLGQESKGTLVAPFQKIDSVQIIDKPSGVPDFNFEVRGNQLVSRVLKVGNHVFKAKVFVQGKSYMLHDSIMVRPPQTIITSRFGQFLIARKENILYASVNGEISENLKLSSNGEELKKLRNGEYLVGSMEPDTVKVSVSVFKDKKETIIGIREFIVVDGSQQFLNYIIED